VARASHAPALLAHLQERGVRPLPAPADPAAAVRARQAQAVVVIDPRFEADLAAGGRPRVSVLVDGSTLRGQVLGTRLVGILETYARGEAARRLERLGVDARTLEPVRVEQVLVSQRQTIADLFLQMVPPFLMFTVFIGGVYLAIDAVAGERERGSLEPLLANPVPRWQVMFGKFLAAYVFTEAALVLQLGAFAVAFNTVDVQLFGGGPGYGARTAILLFLVAQPLMALTVTVQIIIAAMTRSFKEALTWLGLLPIVPAAASFALVFVPVTAQGGLMVVPGVAQTVLFGTIVRGQVPSLLYVALASLSTLLLAAALLRFAARLFEREEIIFTS
jgi:sodium transport system permease protein